MKWLALLLLFTPSRAGEEKGTFLLSFHGEAAGRESYRIESFDTGSTVLFTESKFKVGSLRHVVDSVLTADSRFAPVRYAAYHKAGRAERQSKLTWKNGLITDGRKRLRSRAAFVVDRFIVAHFVPIVRLGAGTVRAFDPAGRTDVEIRIEEGGEVALRAGEKEVRVRVFRLLKGTSSMTAYVDGEGRLIRLDDPAVGLRAERSGFEGLTPGPLDSAPEGPAAREVRLPRGEEFAVGRLTRPESDGPAPGVVLVGTGETEAACGAAGSVPDLFGALARSLANEGMVVLEVAPPDVEAAIRRLRSREDVSSVVLAGFGEGGRVAALGAAGDPELRLLVLLSLGPRPLEEILLERLERQLEDQGVAEEARDDLLDRQRNLFEAVRKADGEYLEIDERKTFIGSLRRRLEFDLAGTLREAGIPIALVYGGKDACLAPEDAERLSREIPHAKVHRLPGLDHHFGRPADRRILERLAEIVLPAGKKN